MDVGRSSQPSSMKNRMSVERKSERELVVTRTFNAAARIVFEASTKPELFKQWRVPKSMGMFLRSCEMDVRVGGTYRLVFGHDASNPDEFVVGISKSHRTRASSGPMTKVVTMGPSPQ